MDPSRAYRKNDRTRVEQNNGAVVRKLVDMVGKRSERSGHTGAAYQSARLYCELLPALLQTSKVRTSMA